MAANRYSLLVLATTLAATNAGNWFSNFFQPTGDVQGVVQKEVLASFDHLKTRVFKTYGWVPKDQGIETCWMHFHNVSFDFESECNSEVCGGAQNGPTGGDPLDQSVPTPIPDPVADPVPDAAAAADAASPQRRKRGTKTGRFVPFSKQYNASQQIDPANVIGMNIWRLKVNMEMPCYAKWGNADASPLSLEYWKHKYAKNIPSARFHITSWLKLRLACMKEMKTSTMNLGITKTEVQKAIINCGAKKTGYSGGQFEVVTITRDTMSSDSAQWNNPSGREDMSQGLGIAFGPIFAKSAGKWLSNLNVVQNRLAEIFSTRKV